MPRPLPVLPKLARRPRRRPDRLLLAFPRISPQWELGALGALMKPQLKDAISHQSATQPIPKKLREQVETALGIVDERLGYRPAVHWPESGDYVFAIEVSPADLVAAQALATVLSARLADVWLVLGRLFVREGRFFRRKRGYRLDLVPAANVHLPRPVRSALNGVLRCEASTSKPRRSKPNSAAR